jgi:hypothetical protein
VIIGPIGTVAVNGERLAALLDAEMPKVRLGSELAFELADSVVGHGEVPGP